MQPTPTGTPRVSAISGDLRPRQHAAMAGLRALGDLDFDHLDLVEPGGLGETFGCECAVVVAAAEITTADFPDDVAAKLAMVGRQHALTGIVGEIAEPGALVQGKNSVGAEGAEAHGRDVEQ